jgi:glutathione synthase/RimK-type ligase-like ATP-grasp enzyme
MGAKHRVLLACASDWTAPARLPRVLRRAGLHATALTAPGRALAATRFIREVIDAPLELDAYIERLREVAAPFDWVWIIDDPLLAALAARRDEPWLDGILPIAPSHPWSAILASKAAFTQLGEAAGLPVPRSRACATLDEARRAAEIVGYPLMLKQSASFGGLGVARVRGPDELAQAWAAVGGDLAVAQSFVDGPIGNTVVLYDHGRAVCWMSAFKERTYPGPFGPSSARRFMDHPDVAPLVERTGALTGYHGFCALDWVRDASDRLRVIELNARPVPTIHFGPLAGVDFGRAVREILDGKPTVQVPPRPPADAPIVPMFPEDVWRAATEDQVRIASWLPRPGRYTDLPWQDLPLLFHHLGRFYRAARGRAVGSKQIGRELT